MAKRVDNAIDILKERFDGARPQSHGMLAQHCSLVCRAAKVMPNLKVAQILIAFNDEDILACEGYIHSRSSARAVFWERLSITSRDTNRVDFC